MSEGKYWLTWWLIICTTLVLFTGIVALYKYNVLKVQAEQVEVTQ